MAKPRSCSMNKPALPCLVVVGALALAALACQTVLPENGPAATATAAGRVPTDPPPPTLPAVSPHLGLSRAEPYPFGAPAELPDWTVEVLELDRGEHAWRRLREANQFNDPPPDGQEYLLVRLRVTSAHADAQPHPIAASDFRITGSRLNLNLPDAAVPPEPELAGELRRGERTEGWGVYLIAADEQQLMLAYDALSEISDAPLRFIALEAGASLSADPALEAIDPTRLGADPREPAPALRATVVTEDWEITVLEVRRGQAAWDLIVAANPYNDPPAAGREYLAVRVRARSIRPGEDPAWITDSAFAVWSGADAEVENPSVVAPEPELNATLFAGGEATGWVVVQAAVGDAGARLRFKPWLTPDDYDTRYFILNP